MHLLPQGRARKNVSKSGSECLMIANGDKCDPSILDNGATNRAFVADDWKPAGQAGECAPPAKIEPSANRKHRIGLAEDARHLFGFAQTAIADFNVGTLKRGIDRIFCFGGSAAYEDEAQIYSIIGHNTHGVENIGHFFLLVGRVAQAEDNHGSPCSALIRSSYSVGEIFDDVGAEGNKCGVCVTGRKPPNCVQWNRKNAHRGKAMEHSEVPGLKGGANRA